MIIILYFVWGTALYYVLRLLALVAAFLSFVTLSNAQEVPGTLAGQPSVSTSGSAQYSFAIETPVGTAGMAPKLFVSYDSNAGPSRLGLGWSISGLTFISRTIRTPFIDGRPGPIDFDNPEDGFAEDALTLDGTRLVAAPEAGYLAKVVDDQTRVSRKQFDNGESYFVAKTKAGLTIYYGESQNSRITTSDGLEYVWAANRIEDTFGNEIHFIYYNVNGDWGPIEVHYTLHRGDVTSADNLLAIRDNSFASIHFQYSDDAGSKTRSFVGGQKIERSRFITSIESRYESTPFRTYQFTYEDTDRLGGRILTSILQKGAAVDGQQPQHRPTTFVYSSNEPSWEKVSDSYDLPDGFGEYTSLNNGYRFADLDADGNDEIIFSAQIGGKDKSLVYKFDGTRWKVEASLRPPVQLSDLREATQPDHFMDLDSDGKLDLIFSQSDGGTFTSRSFLQSGGKWVETADYNIPFPLVKDGQRTALISAVTSTSTTDFVQIELETSDARYWYHDGSSWKSSDIDLEFTLTDPTDFVFGDFTCQGIDILSIASSTPGQVVFFSYDFSDVQNPDVELQASLQTSDLFLAPVVASLPDCDRLILATDDGIDQNLVALELDQTGFDPQVKATEVTSVPITDGRIEQITLSELLSQNIDEVVVVSSGSALPNVSAFQFDPGNGTWARNQDYDYDPANTDLDVDASYIAFGARANAGATEDVLLLPSASGVATAALVNRSPGLSFSTRIVPPVHFAQQEKIGSSPQFLDLNADGLVDVIGHHLDRDGKVLVNSAFLNISTGWSQTNELRLPKPLTHEKGGRTGALVDFTSDGIPDFVYSYGNETSAWVIEFDETGNPLGWKRDPRFDIPNKETFSHPDHGDRGLRFFDVNGDARLDLVIARRNQNGDFYTVTYLNTGSRWNDTPADPKFNSPVPFVSGHYHDLQFDPSLRNGSYFRDLGVQTTDLNGDGAIDLLFRYRHTGPRVGSGGTVVSTAQKDGCLNMDKVIPGQNPQDPPQIIPHPIDYKDTCVGVYYGTGNGWRNPGSGWVEIGGQWVVRDDIHFPPVPLDIRITAENASTDFADVNGDGLVDFLPARLVNASNQHPAYLNTGRGWKADNLFKIPNPSLSSDKRYTSHRLIDLNGDGLLDLAFNRPGAKGTYLNSGNRWLASSPSYAPPEKFINDKGEDLGVRLVDVDGNGLPDILRSYRGKDGKLTQTAYLNSRSLSGTFRESRIDIVRSITTGMGSTTEFGYRSLIAPRTTRTLSGSEFYTPSPVSPYPMITYVPAMYAVQQLTIVESDGTKLHTRYKYKGFRYNAIVASPLGFEARWASNYIGDSFEPIITEKLEFFQDYFRLGRSRVESSSVKETTLNETENTYEVVDGATALPKRVNLTVSHAQNYDLNGAQLGNTSEFYRYDKFNDATVVCIEYGDGSRTLTENSFDRRQGLLNPDVWFLGRLTEATVTHTRTSQEISCPQLMDGGVPISEAEKLTSTASFAYDIELQGNGLPKPENSGVLVSETSNSGHKLALTKSYTHDGFGNTIQARSRGFAEKERVRSYIFDSLGRFATSEVNALGHQTQRVYHPTLGLVIKITDPNGVSIENDYDGFGQLIQTRSPSNLESTQTRAFSDGPIVFGRKVVMETTEQVGSLPAKTTFFDYQGRTLRIETIGFEGKKVIQEVAYDERGREVRSSLPYFENEQVYFTETTHDDLNRVVKVVSPDGSTTTSVYDGVRTSVLDDLGSEVIKVVNLKGLTVMTIDTKGSELNFEYGPGDRLVKTVLVNGHELVNEYDQVGNKIRSIDADLGQWDYKYNSFGEVIWQRDAKGQITEIEYDLLGRLALRTMPDNIEEFAYDSAIMGVGKPTSVSNVQGFREAYFYDRYGRLKKTETQIDNELFRTAYAYDEYDRIRSTFYPGNFRTESQYDEYGFLRLVLANDPTGSFLEPLEVQWEALSRDQFGRITEERFGNDVVTATRFDKTQGSIESIMVSADDRAIYDLNLEYDVAGNLTLKDERTRGRKETYSYDELYRIQRWVLNGKTKGLYEYDSAGRILKKSDVGTYTYDKTGPVHGVSRIKTKSGENWTYKYDANGNMVFGPKGHFEYNANNSVKLIYRSDELWSKFRYAPDGSRYRQEFSQRKKIADMIGHSSLVRTTTVGAYERIEDIGSAFGIAPHGFARDRLHIATESGVVAVLETNVQYDPLHGYHKKKAANLNLPISIAKSGFVANYIHKDELGSIVRVTDEESKVVAAYEYDPWGSKTRLKAFDPNGREHLAGSFRRGFTSHEHLENLELVHMDGRVFDPTIASFTSADPFVQSVQDPSNYNRYSYVHNNPLKYVDPTGFFSLKKALKKLGRAIAKPFEKLGKWFEKNWRTVVVVVVAVAITYFSAGTLSPVAAGMLAGATAGGLNAALHGGDAHDIFRGAIIGGAFGAAFGGAAQFGGYVASSYGSTAGQLAGTAAVGTVGGLQAEMSGGNFWSGFASAAVASAFSRYTNRIRSVPARYAVASVAGGTVSEIGGGKFANGAVTAAYTQLALDIISSLDQPIKIEPEQPKQIKAKPVRIRYNARPPQTVPVTGETEAAVQCFARCAGLDEIFITGGAETRDATGRLLHSRNSLHYSNEAIDFPRWQSNGQVQITEQIVNTCAPGCGFSHGQYEIFPRTPRRNHWHLQTRPGNGARPIPGSL